MKRTKVRKLVFTDGKYYYHNSTGVNSIFTSNPREAWNFYCERWTDLNDKRDLHWQIEAWTKHKPCLLHGGDYIKQSENLNIDWSNFKMKWITIIETIKEEDFNYEGFSDDHLKIYGDKYKNFPI